MESGICKNCGSENIKYKERKEETNLLIYPYYCNDCGHNGKEFYNVEYSYSE